MCQCCTEKDIYLPELASVTDRKMLTDNEVYVRVALDSGRELGHQPGQFVEVSVAGIGEAPISISSSPTQEGFEMVVRNAGSLTRAIGGLDVGDKLGIRGPFGSTYPVEEAVGKDLVFICGGIGLVPQRSFINYALDNRDKYGEITILLGNKGYNDRLFLDELGEWSKRDGVNFVETIDTGHPSWNGNVGVVTTLIPKITSDLSTSLILICGPPIMYKFVL
ncbi:MAG: FAD/NAD(P)-binding protein, partial [Planctomycetes bacterium]|nr:FAD/NAD(P)-binding protein [Planctomycetota bacterium]